MIAPIHAPARIGRKVAGATPLPAGAERRSPVRLGALPADAFEAPVRAGKPAGTDRRVELLADRIAALDPARPAWARLVALSGIDASGKGAVARATAAALERRGLRVALVGLDDWHQPADVRFGGEYPGEHFYWNAFDFEEVFSQVVEPLRLHRNLWLTTERAHPFTGRPLRLQYDWSDVDVVLFEGVFLLRRELRPRYDLRVWVDCPFVTALERARRRNQEGLPDLQLVADYQGIYFPAQRVHLDRDRPKDSADLVFENGETAPLLD